MLKTILFLLLANVLFVMNLSAAQEIIIPKALKPGDTIGLIAPANYKGDTAQAEVDYLLSRGFKVVYGKSFDSTWY